MDYLGEFKLYLTRRKLKWWAHTDTSVHYIDEDGIIWLIEYDSCDGYFTSKIVGHRFVKEPEVV